ncbi:MAG: efflux RND transporter periplasmic adaptor subunit [Pseudomonadota bacterium]|nr:efflux RND transporter periplasmic adaptor subunit [Pseudomonadota bacterium]
MRTLTIAWFAQAVACAGSPGEAGKAQAGQEHAEREHGEERHEENGHGEEHEEFVKLSPEALTVAALRVESASSRSSSGSFATSARIALDPRREAQVSAATAGQVDRILVRTGETVRDGQTLATVVSAELGEAVAAFHTSHARREVASARAERLRGLEGQGVSSKADVAEADAELKVAAAEFEAAEERLRVLGVRPDASSAGHYPSQFPVRSPIAGEVLAAEARVGQSVQPGAGLFHIGNLDEVWLLLDVYERDLAKVGKGQEVRFRVDAWPDVAFEGTVDWVGAVVQPDSRTVELRVVVPNADHRLKPGMFARADLGLAPHANGGALVVVPAEAVQEFEGRSVVFVQSAPDTFAARTVRIASRHGSDVHLAEGVTPGEPIVVEGAFTLKSELAKGELGERHAH